MYVFFEAYILIIYLLNEYTCAVAIMAEQKLFYSLNRKNKNKEFQKYVFLIYIHYEKFKAIWIVS